MLQFEELKRELHEKQAALEDLKDALGLERLREEVEMLENKAAEPGFWDNMEAAQKVLQKTAALKQKDEIQKRYKQIVDNLFATLRGGQRERNLDRFRSKVSDLKNSGDKRLRFERDRLYGKVRQLESDIATLENNIGFFSRSKNAESMIREVEQKIAKAKQEMADTIEKIKLIDSQQE